MSVTNFPIDPRKIAEVEDSLADEDDPDIKAALRQKLIEQLQIETNESVRLRRAYREAFKAARDAGDHHPRITATFAVRRQRLIDQYEGHVRAISNRGEARHRRRVDKHKRDIEKASKSAKPDQRRFPQRDRDYVDIIGKAEKDGWLGNVPLVLSEINSRLGRYRLPHWEKTTTSLKVMAMSIVCARDGAQTVNLRINPDVCAKALASIRGPAGYMQDRIRKAFEKTFDREAIPEFWFVVEMQASRGFHLHGAVITPAIINGVELVNDALRAAGGVWASPFGQQHQQKSLGLNEPIYWASYACKSLAVGGHRTDRKLFASTLGIRSRASAGWDALRASLPQSP